MQRRNNELRRAMETHKTALPPTFSHAEHSEVTANAPLSKGHNTNVLCWPTVAHLKQSMSTLFFSLLAMYLLFNKVVLYIRRLCNRRSTVG